MTLGKGKSIWYLRYKEKTNTNKSWKNDTAKYTVLGRPQPITWQQNDAQNHAGTGSGDQIPIRDFRLYILHGTWKDGSDERRRRRTSTPVRADRKGNRITSLYNRAEQKSISWAGWATTAEDPIAFRSRKARRGVWGYRERRLTQTHSGWRTENDLVKMLLRSPRL